MSSTVKHSIDFCDLIGGVLEGEELGKLSLSGPYGGRDRGEPDRHPIIVA